MKKSEIQTDTPVLDEMQANDTPPQSKETADLEKTSASPKEEASNAPLFAEAEVEAKAETEAETELEAPAENVPADDTAALAAEVDRLRDELARRDAMSERMARESEELYALYPDLDLRTLPDSVWEDVRRGVPIAAAYALAERKRVYREQKAAICNQVNRDRSTGAIDGAGSDYFSPAEVRQMSAAEVRKNYTSIMHSMQKWH